ncbi:hypothetical protein GEMRC1_013433 [Eukaryota sp. GEM-RC1]
MNSAHDRPSIDVDVSTELEKYNTHLVHSVSRFCPEWPPISDYILHAYQVESSLVVIIFCNSVTMFKPSESYFEPLLMKLKLHFGKPDIRLELKRLHFVNIPTQPSVGGFSTLIGCDSLQPPVITGRDHLDKKLDILLTWLWDFYCSCFNLGDDNTIKVLEGRSVLKLARCLASFHSKSTESDGFKYLFQYLVGRPTSEVRPVPQFLPFPVKFDFSNSEQLNTELENTVSLLSNDHDFNDEVSIVTLIYLLLSDYVLGDIKPPCCVMCFDFCDQTEDSQGNVNIIKSHVTPNSMLSNVREVVDKVYPGMTTDKTNIHLFAGDTHQSSASKFCRPLFCKGQQNCCEEIFSRYERFIFNPNDGTATNQFCSLVSFVEALRLQKSLISTDDPISLVDADGHLFPLMASIFFRQLVIKIAAVLTPSSWPNFFLLLQQLPLSQHERDVLDTGTASTVTSLRKFLLDSMNNCCETFGLKMFVCYVPKGTELFPKDHRYHFLAPELENGQFRLFDSFCGCGEPLWLPYDYCGFFYWRIGLRFSKR